jgi:hypothetical protein
LPAADGRNKREASDRRAGAEGTKRGQGSTALTAPSFPCRYGKLRVKIFSGLAPHPKVVSDEYLGRDSRVEPRARQGNGREAQKPADRRLSLLS